ncbi:sensor histidine kinase [Paenibacillus solisilvae]|uniref:histidine kinase n=1 Tax=Paenibacillus solisilvae TaxID=2486751 RepID=A0ABW0VUC2_9BACL
MPYKRIKWLILWTPTVTIALWEYIRHTFLLPYLSMDLGNALAPVIVLTVTVTLVYKLFHLLEQTSDSLQRERLAKAAFVEREQLARELHDGISQSLFLLSVKLDKLEHTQDKESVQATAQQIRKTVKHVYDDVRQSIASLRSEPSMTEVQWMQSVEEMAVELRLGGLQVELDWRLTDSDLTSKEKIELLAIVREAMLNVQKHARAKRLIVNAFKAENISAGGFNCTIMDDGIGVDDPALEAKGRYGVRMMRDRANAMGWQFEVGRNDSKDNNQTVGTVVAVTKGG